MDRHLRRHQQPVAQRGARARKCVGTVRRTGPFRPCGPAGWVRVVAALLLGVCGLGVAMAAAGGAFRGCTPDVGATGSAQTAPADGEGAGVGSAAPEAGGAFEEAGGGSEAAGAGASGSESSAPPDAKAADLSTETFLAELARKSEEAGSAATSEDAGEVAVSWTEERGLVSLASDVLTAYGDIATATLATSGYLDLRGNVWAALVQDARGWVDVVTVTSAADDGSATVHVARLLASAAPES